MLLDLGGDCVGLRKCFWFEIPETNKSEFQFQLEFTFWSNFYLFGSILLELYKLHVVLHLISFSILMESICFGAWNFYNSDFMDLWRRDEDESKSLGILVVTSYFLVLIVFFFFFNWCNSTVGKWCSVKNNLNYFVWHINIFHLINNGRD